MKVDTSDYARPCSCGREHGIEVKEIIIEPGAAKVLKDMMDGGSLKDYFHPVIVCDTNTFEATLEEMEDVFDCCQMIRLDAEGLQADRQGIDILSANMEEDIDLLIAVGAGTIHDLVRFVAHEQEIDYVSVPTAASGDGFASNVASIQWNGVKRIVPATAPICVIADTNIFSKAPMALNVAGISGLLGKYTAFADWRISHLLTDEYICEEIIAQEQKALEKAIASMRDIPEGDEKACERLMYALILSGLTMQMTDRYGSSFGAEHQISHLWRMDIINDKLNSLYGEQLGVGFLVCLEYYKEMARNIRNDAYKVVAYQGMEESLLEQHFAPHGVLDQIREENIPDPLMDVDEDHLLQSLPQIAEIIESLPEPQEIINRIQSIHGKTTMEEIGISQDKKTLTLELAPYVRNRLSLLRVSKLLEL